MLLGTTLVYNDTKYSVPFKMIKRSLAVFFFTKNNSNLSLQKRKEDPPLLRNHPPIAGAIFWSRFLFDRLKRPVLIFQKIEELKNSSLKNEVSIKYSL
jgi:dynein heavy chain